MLSHRDQTQITSVLKELNAEWIPKGQHRAVEGSFLIVLPNHFKSNHIMRRYMNESTVCKTDRACSICTTMSAASYTVCETCYDVMDKYRRSDPVCKDNHILHIKYLSKLSRETYQIYVCRDNKINIATVIRSADVNSRINELSKYNIRRLLPRCFLIRELCTLYPDIPKEIAYIIMELWVKTLLNPY